MSKKTAGLRITGYEVAYSRYKDFREFVAYRVEGYKTTSETIKGLKAKKKYYVKVRTFIRKGSKIYYSPWSKAKSVKTK